MFTKVLASVRFPHSNSVSLSSPFNPHSLAEIDKIPVRVIKDRLAAVLLQ